MFVFRVSGLGCRIEFRVLGRSRVRGLGFEVLGVWVTGLGGLVRGLPVWQGILVKSEAAKALVSTQKP